MLLAVLVLLYVFILVACVCCSHLLRFCLVSLFVTQRRLEEIRVRKRERVIRI